MNQHTDMEAIISLAKRRGFVFQGSEIYGGLAGTWDYGPLGVLLKNNIKQSWLDKFVSHRTDTYLIDAAILMNHNVWEASGHVEGFHDPMVTDTTTNKRYRADHLLEQHGIDAEGLSIQAMDSLIKEKSITSPDGNPLGPVQQFNMMLQTSVGAAADSASVSYLRPETAQGIFVNVKNIMDTMRPKVPFGVAQIGKAFRNEITPRDFVFRTREFEQMEIEYFVHPDTWQDQFEYWKDEMLEWMGSIGLDMNKVHDIEIPADKRAHYSGRTVDFEFEYPFGQKELYGLAYRKDYDLKKHMEASGVSLEYQEQTPDGLQKFVPHVIEPSFGLDRTVLAVLVSAYTIDTTGGEERVFLNIPGHIAPYQVAVSPLLKNKPELVTQAQTVFHTLKQSLGNVAWDDNGNIGKRYRRQDEIGTPLCVVIDYDTLEDHTVTVRHRNTTQQERVAIDDLGDYIARHTTQAV